MKEYNYITVESTEKTNEVVHHKTLRKASAWAKTWKKKSNEIRIYKFIKET